MAAEGRRRGLGLVDAPVSGGEQGAIEGALSVMAGGTAEDVEAARPVLERVGRTVARVGPSGAGQTVKAANQLIVAGILELVAESIVFLEAHGIDTEIALPLLQGGLAGSAVLDRKGAAMRVRDFKPGFRAELHHKDLGIVTAAAREAQVAIPLGTVVAQLFGALTAQGKGQLDHSALLLLALQLAGRADSDPMSGPRK
jgi:2-hydroxy-3-oxopropionate reductase